MVTDAWLQRTLASVGKTTFKNCYDDFASNYMKEDKYKLEEAILKDGLERNGVRYKDNSLKTKVNAGCAIFREKKQKEALELCK